MISPVNGKIFAKAIVEREPEKTTGIILTSKMNSHFKKVVVEYVDPTIGLSKGDLLLVQKGTGMEYKDLLVFGVYDVIAKLENDND
jgi:hypothetical protein